MDPTTSVEYAFIYVVAIAVAVLLLLPILITCVLLLLVAGALQLVFYLLKIATASLVRGIVALFKGPDDGRRPRGHGGRLVPH